MAGLAGDCLLRCPDQFPDARLRRELEEFVREQYAAGRSLREISELTDRSWSWVRKELERQGVARRGHWANRVNDAAAAQG